MCAMYTVCVAVCAFRFVCDIETEGKCYSRQVKKLLIRLGTSSLKNVLYNEPNNIILYVEIL